MSAGRLDSHLQALFDVGPVRQLAMDLPIPRRRRACRRSLGALDRRRLWKRGFVAKDCSTFAQKVAWKFLAVFSRFEKTAKNFGGMINLAFMKQYLSDVLV